MIKKLHTHGPVLNVIQDTGVTPPRIGRREVETALGGEASAEGLEGALAPLTLFAVREESVKRLQPTRGMRRSLPQRKRVLLVIKQENL